MAVAELHAPTAYTALGDVDKLRSQYTQEYQRKHFLSTIVTKVFNAEYNVFSQLNVSPHSSPRQAALMTSSLSSIKMMYSRLWGCSTNNF